MSRVTLTNPFDLLTDENEDRTNVQAPKKEQKPAAPAKPAAKPAATGVAAKPAAKQAAPQKQEGAKDAKAAPKANTNNVVKPAPIRDSNSTLVEREKESRPPRDRRDAGRPAPVGEKKDKRPFDRKSGTGRPQTENKRGGQGKNNWGGEVDTKEAEALNKEEKVAEKEEADDAKDEKVDVEVAEKKEGETKEEVAPAPVDEEVITYEEYLKTKAKAAPKVDALVPRTVTADDFGGLTALSREDAAPLTKKAEKPKAEKAKAAPTPAEKDKKEKVDLSKLLKFESHQDAKYKERRDYNRSYSDDTRRGSAERRPSNKGTRRTDSQSNVNKPPVQEKDFPALGPHGSDPVKA